MPRREIAWLHAELPKLVAEGILAADVADAIARYYGPATPGTRRSAWIPVVLAAFGAVLVGGGVILILAHNWDQLDRSTRAAIAVGTLVAAQVLVAYAVRRRPDEPAWIEASAALLVAAVGAAIALVGQTYHVAGSLDTFLRSWLWLVMPIPYLTGSVLASMGFWTILVVRVSELPAALAPWDLWPLVIAGLPFVFLEIRHRPAAWRTALVAHAAAISLLVTGSIVAVSSAWPGLWAVLDGGYLAALCAASAWPPAAAREHAWRRGLWGPAHLGVLVLAVVLSFDEPWTAGGIRWRSLSEAGVVSPAVVGAAVLAVGSAAYGAMVASRLWEAQVRHESLWAGAGLLAVGLHALALAGAPDLPWIVFNAWLLAAGVATLWAGVRDARLGTANLGLLCLAALIAARFFDVDLSFLVRGAAFVALGAACLVTNLVLARRARRASE